MISTTHMKLVDFDKLENLPRLNYTKHMVIYFVLDSQRNPLIFLITSEKIKKYE